MRILHLVDGHVFDRSSWCAHRAYRVARSQIELGFEPFVVSSRSPFCPLTDPDEAFRHESLDVDHLKGSWIEMGHGLNTLRRRVRKLIQRDKTQVLHIYGHPLIATAGLAAARQSRVGAVWEPTSIADNPSRVLGWGLRAFDAIVTPSRLHAADWAERGGRRAHIFHIPDGIPAWVEHRAEPARNRPAFVLSPIMDEEPDVRWFRRALARRPDLKPHIEVWVPGRDNLDLLRIDAGLGPHQVHELDPSLAGLRTALPRASALIYLNRSPHRLPLEVLQAGAEARTVIGPADAVMRELIRSGSNGFLGPHGDDVVLADHLGLAAEDADDMGRSLASDVRRRRAWSVLVEGYFEVYDQAARAARSGGTLYRMTTRWDRLMSPGLTWRSQR